MNKLRSNDDDGRFLEIDVFKDVSMSNFIFLCRDFRISRFVISLLERTQPETLTKNCDFSRNLEICDLETS